ncbi:MAG: acetoacetate decarboxylase family protein [Cyanosarcina radialis HA8281-LM2]|jgi:hypothetical protein|nr:acetoacetate decarboxylase family protein [Cyanosarcina radialis HA8281-LM2]
MPAYPPTPWKLQGHALQTLHSIDIKNARPLIPSEFNIISIWPGKTLGGVYLSAYSSGSVLEYSELIVIAGVVSYAGKLGAWISHIYVDNPNSVAGGREIWGLPKELAQFTWQQEEDGWEASASLSSQELCRLSYSQTRFSWPLPFKGTVFSTLGTDILCFPGQLKSHLGLVRSNLTVPPQSSFAGLNLGQPWLTVYCDRLDLTVNAPTRVGALSL